MQSVHYALRQLTKTPAFTLTSVVSLALGIGASVTMFSAFRSVFLRPLPYHQANRIVEIEKIGPNGSTPANTVADLEFFRRYARFFDALAGYGFFETATLSGIADPTDLWVRRVSSELFPLLGTKPLLGRTFVASDFQSGAPRTVVIAFTTWQKYFSGDPGVIGRSIFLNGQSSVVVGVMPQEFYFPKPEIAAWLPSLAQVTDAEHSYTAIVGRLRQGASLDRANAELNRLSSALLFTYPSAERNFKMTVQAVATRDVEHYRAAFLLLLGAAGFLVLLSCLNAASLLLAKALARRNEFAVRAALGAGRTRLIGQVLTESLILAGLSGASGVLLAYLGNCILRYALPPYLGIPRLENTRLDLTVLGFAVLLTFSVALLFGLVPALELSAPKLNEADHRSRSATATPGRIALC